ncbi:coiled-coil domain-containing protein 174 [Bactrocera dorsalis]|uniref:Coiled-coil domain-containing protein 174 n=1 Tax=Bactrocera dorsalis TaxID=27457 RepID=A0A6I9W0W5_BACDO|nr:coiled-coil domain-containing protein 174 [Bactrocera dorsalis]
MNDPNKAINVNLSSLLSLKAELLRKQAEVSKAKTAQAQTQPSEYTAKKLQTFNNNNATTEDAQSNKKYKKSRTKEVESGEDVTVYEYEDTELVEKSKRVLEAKSKFYERMTRTGGQLNSDDNCLVLFNRKHQEECKNNNNANRYDEQCTENDVKNSESESEDEVASDEEEDWVEYTDCLGRTRKCLREDLETIKKRDAELAATMPERLDQSKANWMINTKNTDTAKLDEDAPFGPMPCESLFGDGISLMSKHDEQRANWERKEQENLDKIDVHYQDVFFDEARQHGVGYYTFSTDEEERKKQQKELEEIRKGTIDEQNRREQLRAQREKIIAERVFAAKNRQRARLGLPPLEKVEEREEDANTKKETKEERRARKKEEKNRRKQEKYEKERELERQNHLRPWDKEKLFKESSNLAKDISQNEQEPKWSYKPEKLPMSQEQWNEKKRSERITEFAPISNPQIQKQYQPKRKNFTSMPPPEEQNLVNSSNNDKYCTTENFANYQSSKSDKRFQCRSYCAETTEPERLGVNIAPPVDLDYVSPPHTKKPKSNSELEKSIEAGLRFLRNNSDKGNLTTKSSWTAKADY